MVPPTVFGEVRGHPAGDGRGARPPPKLWLLAPDVVVDLVLGHDGLELGQRGRRVGAVEPADGHHRIAAGGQLQRRGLLGAFGGRHPRVAGRAASPAA